MEIDVEAAERPPTPTRKLFARKISRTSLRTNDPKQKFFPDAEANNQPPAVVVRPKLQALYSPQNGTASLMRMQTMEEAAGFYRQNSVMQDYNYFDGQESLVSVRQENQQLRISIREKERMLESLLKQPGPAIKAKNRSQLEALVARDREFLEELRRHNEEFRKETDTPSSKQSLRHRQLTRDKPQDLRRRLFDYQQRILQYHQEQIELRERMEKQLEAITTLTQQKEQFSKKLEKVNIEGRLSEIMNSSRQMDEFRSEVLFDSTEATLQLNAVTQHNARLQKDVNQLVKVLNICHREYAKKEKSLLDRIADFGKIVADLQAKIVSLQASTAAKQNHNCNHHPVEVSPQSRANHHTFKKKSGEIIQPGSGPHSPISNNFPSGFWMRSAEEEPRFQETLCNSLFSFGLEEPSVMQLTENNELREEFKLGLRNWISKYIDLETSKLGALLLQFTSKLFFYPDHAELMQFMGPLCQAMRRYQQYQQLREGSFKNLIHTFKEQANDVFAGSGSSSPLQTSLEGNICSA